MVVIVDNVTAKNEEGGDEVIVKIAKGIKRDIKDLLRCAQASNNFYYETILIDFLLISTVL
jgi:hypothetical protein